MRNRYYSVTTGRFLTKDPLGAHGDNVNAGNEYAYCGNAPLTISDPSGLMAQDPQKKPCDRSVPSIPTAPTQDTAKALAVYKAMYWMGWLAGSDMAAPNLGHWLAGTGQPVTVGFGHLLSYSAFSSAVEAINQEVLKAYSDGPGGTGSKAGERHIDAYSGGGLDRLANLDLAYGSGKSCIKYEASWKVDKGKRTGRSRVEIDIRYTWSDLYDWNPGQSASVPFIGRVSDDQALALEAAGIGKEFWLSSTGRLRIEIIGSRISKVEWR